MKWKVELPSCDSRFYTYGGELVFKPEDSKYYNLRNGVMMSDEVIDKLEQIPAGSYITITA